MKKIIFLFLLFVSVNIGFSQSKNAIKLNLFGGVEFEHGFKGNHAANIQYRVLLKPNINGYLVNLGYRYYFKESIKGIYFSPMLSIGQFNSTEYHVSATMVGLGFAFGSQWIWWKHFVLDANIGYGQYALSDDYNNSEEFGTLLLKLGIGYAF